MTVVIRVPHQSWNTKRISAGLPGPQVIGEAQKAMINQKPSKKKPGIQTVAQK